MGNIKEIIILNRADRVGLSEKKTIEKELKEMRKEARWAAERTVSRQKEGPLPKTSVCLACSGHT